MTIKLGKPYLKKDVILNEISRVLDRNWISGGPAIEEFENALRKYNNDDGFYVSVANATVGIELAIRLALDDVKLKKNDEIIVPSWSWVSSAFAPITLGAKIIWADVNGYGVISASEIQRLISSKTKAIMVVHQMGVPCDMDEIQKIADEHNIPIIEDCACAFGSEYKSKKIGVSKNICVYSHQARKCLVTGEGGTIVVRTEKEAEWLRSMRAFGTNVSPLKRDMATCLLKESFDKIGTNYKISDIQCALGLAHLSYFDEEIELREAAGLYYNRKIIDLKDQHNVSMANHIPDYCTRYNWQNYHILLGHEYNRDKVVDLLRRRNIGCKWDIQAIHKEPAINSKLKLIRTDVYHNHGLWLPFYAEITREEQDIVLHNLDEVLTEVTE